MTAQATVESGIADAYVLTTVGSFGTPTTLQDGARYRFRAGNANTGASTININGLGAKDIKKNGYADALAANDIVADYWYSVVYDSGSDDFELISESATVDGTGGVDGSSAFWDSEVSKTANYTILTADAGDLIYQGSATVAERTFTFDAGFPDKGVVYVYNDSATYRLIINDGTDDILFMFKADGIYKLTKSALTGEINITEA